MCSLSASERGSLTHVRKEYKGSNKYNGIEKIRRKDMRRYDYSDEVVNVVKQFLAEDESHYSFDEDTGVFRFGFLVRSRIQNISFFIDVQEDEFITYGICPITADRKDPQMMAKMAEFICRANYGLKNGCFELDYRDGSIRYRSYVDCENLLPSTEVVRNSIYCTTAMIKRYAQGIVDIIFGGSTAKDAVTKCEKSANGESHSTEEELRSVLEESLGEDASEETFRELLSHLASELGITKDSHKDSQENEDRPEDIRLDPFSSEGGEAC